MRELIQKLQRFQWFIIRYFTCFEWILAVCEFWHLDNIYRQEYQSSFQYFVLDVKFKISKSQQAKPFCSNINVFLCIVYLLTIVVNRIDITSSPLSTVISMKSVIWYTIDYESFSTRTRIKAHVKTDSKFETLWVKNMCNILNIITSKLQYT